MTERRTWTFPTAEFRFEGADDERRIVGYPAVFNKRSVRLWDFHERVKPGAFTKTIGEHDIRALFNHDPNMLLGRTKNHTLDLSEDKQGLLMDARLPDTQAARDTYTLVSRGDVDQGSFTFDVVRDHWARNKDQDESLWLRDLIEVRLYDVSPVTFPAYEDTAIEVRSLNAELGIEGPVDGFSQLNGVVLRAARGIAPLPEERKLMRDALSILHAQLTTAPSQEGHPVAEDRSEDEDRASEESTTTPGGERRSTAIGVLRRRLELITRGL